MKAIIGPTFSIILLVMSGSLANEGIAATDSCSVAIVDDTAVIAVGEIHIKDSIDNWDLNQSYIAKG